MARPRKQSRDVFQDDVIGTWRVVSESPVRTNEKLIWTICCPFGHEVKAEHSALSYGVVPMQCAQCVQQAATARANERIEEKRLAKELAAEMYEQMHKEKMQQAQPAQIQGLNDPDQRFGHVRALIMPAQQEVIEGAGI